MFVIFYILTVCRHMLFVGMVMPIMLMSIGCGLLNTQSALPEASVSTQSSPEAIAVEPAAVVKKQELDFTQRLLEQADDALREGRLVLPEYDNAFDRFQSVLILSPDNVQARSGLQAILVGLAADARYSIGVKQFYRARQQIRQLGDYFPKTALAGDLQHELREEQAKIIKIVEVETPRPPQGDYEDIVLSQSELTERSDAIRQQLQSVADKVVVNKSMVMIYARSDKEGRWIYKQLKQSAKDYRVRGDIRIGKPKLRLLPPLE